MVAQYCDDCGGEDFQPDQDDGHFYCTACGAQSKNLIQTAIDEDHLQPDSGFYNSHYIRSQSQPQNPNPKSKSEVLRELDQALKKIKQDPSENFLEFDEQPRDFGSACWSDAEKLADEIRFRYVKGLQVMLQGQCEALVEKFGVSPYIVGIAGTIWLRYVAMTRVLADDWPDRMIKESEKAAEASGHPRIVKDENPAKSRRSRFSSKSEPRNSYGQRTIYIWLRSLRNMLPLHSTLAISFLLCHIARESVLPTDIFRWASEGKLPYLAAFVDMDRRIGNPLNTFTLSSMTLFRPDQVIGSEQLEAVAASIAQTIGLRLPSVNFYAIAQRFLKELYLPVEKILPYACRIYEWSLPLDLWLSSDDSGFPTRACVMSILIVTIRFLYTIQGQGTWEASQSEVRNPHSKYQRVQISPENADFEKSSTAPSSKSNQKLLQAQNSDYNCKELLNNLEITYHKINIAHDYSKDLVSYLKHCKDVVFAGTTKSSEEKKLMGRLWDMFEKQENDNEEDEKKPSTGVSKDPPLVPKKGKEIYCDQTTPIGNVAVEKMRLEMEENGFKYLPPRSHAKIDRYLQYKRQRINGEFVYVAHVDYYILLRACAKLVQLDAKTLHRCILSLERRIDWIDRQIDKLF